MALRDGFWAMVEEDDLIHAATNIGWKTFCGKKVVKTYVCAIPEPKVVDCETCLEAGAYNVPRPESGRYFSARHVMLYDAKVLADWRAEHVG